MPPAEAETALCEAVLFDAVGTLVAPHPSVGAVYAAVAADFGVEGDAKALEAGFRAAWRERAAARFEGEVQRRTSNARERRWWRGTVRRTFEHAGLPDPGDGCFAALFRRFGQGRSWRVFDDVRPALRGLQGQGLRLGVVSNFDSRLHRILDDLDLALLLDAVILSAEAGCAKPAQGIWDAAVAAVGAAPRRVLMVGDSLVEDVTGARAAGCQALLLDREGRHSRPDAIRTLTALAARLRP
ncbi:MAG: HAD-IA family hydrolase [Planctomycetota bacterium]